MRPVLITVWMLMLAAPVSAFERVNEAQDFARLIEGRILTRFGIRLEVSNEGRIAGRGFGWPVSGAWRCENGFF